MKFEKLVINKQWQQFETIDIVFHEKLTILTGANGCGKTTILEMLARHSGWDKLSVATPYKNILSKAWNWFSGWFEDEQHVIGEISYDNGTTSELIMPETHDAQYSIQIPNMQSVPCFFIPSHRSVFRYQKLLNIPTQGTIDRRTAFQKVFDSNRNRYLGGNDQSSSFYMKETLVAWNLFGRGNEDMEPNEIMLENYKGFEDILKIVLPKELGFSKFIIKNFEVVLDCNTGQFPIDASSGGISAILDMAWQIYMYFVDKKTEFTVIIDEVENHLHPTMQRRILSDFVNAFPSVHFIVSTHSPLIVGSVKNSKVYVLRNNNDNKVISSELDFVNKAKTAAEILDEVLGVSFTMPIWAEVSLKEIVKKYSSRRSDKDVFKRIRSDLTEIGLGQLVPEAIGNIVEMENEEN